MFHNLVASGTDMQPLIRGKSDRLAERMNRLEVPYSFEEDSGKPLHEGLVMPTPGRPTGDPVVTDHPTN